jgi:polysaccharide deacetylase 2 family uncharacterized protein YibQ
MMIGCRGLRPVYAITLLLLFSGSGFCDDAETGADHPPAAQPTVRIALIIDDLGDVLKTGQRAAALDGPVACAVLPHTPFGRIIAKQAYGSGKEVILHLPLQPVAQIQMPGTGVIEIDNTRSQLVKIFEADINSVPYVVGVSSHMGSLLTQHPGHMNWLMSAVKARGDLFFVDSYTTVSSVALQFAREHEIPAIRRDVFLDTERTAAAIDKEFKRLKQRARKHGVAVGIGHPYTETLEYLENVLPGLRDEGIELVAVKDLLGGKAYSRQTASAFVEHFE